METTVVDVTTQQTKTLPDTVRVFHLTWTNPETGRTESGEFTVQRLNLGKIREMAIRRAQLNGGLNENALTSEVRMFNMMCAHLELAVTNAPSWWKPDEFFSIKPIEALYEEVLSFENSFRRPVEKRTERPTSNRERQPKQPAQDDSALVVPEI